MEAVLCGSEWAGFGDIFYTEENNFMSELSTSNLFSSEQSSGESSETSYVLPCQDRASGFDENLYYNCQDNTYTESSSVIDPARVEEHYYLNNFSPILKYTNSCNPVDSCFLEEQNLVSGNDVMEEVDFLKNEMSNYCLGDLERGILYSDQSLNSKRKYEITQVNTSVEINEKNVLSERKLRISGTVRRNNKTIQAKNDGNYDDMNEQKSGSNSTEEETNVEHPQGSELVDLKGKARARRGSATDAQSVYARKRRERINERLRTLQRLVPNGTKVDISTMLEEAVQYVKFLQDQIKLLSSDDLWMYAPLAYNGMDIGIHLNLSLPH